MEKISLILCGPERCVIYAGWEKIMNTHLKVASPYLQKCAIAKALALAGVLLVCPIAFAQAETYRPFVFSDPLLNQRKDLHDKLPELKVDLPVSSRAQFVRVPADGADLFFTPELADFLERAAAPTPAIPSDAAAILSRFCPLHSTFSSEPFVNSSPSCAGAAEQLKQSFSAVSTVCRYVFLPEQFVESWPVGKVDSDNLDNVDGILRTAGEPLSHLTFPGNFTTADSRASFRVIIAKLRSQQLQQAIVTADLAYSQSLGSARGQPQCINAAKLAQVVTGLRSELQQAQQYLSDLDKTGRAQAELDRRAVLANGRQRPELPYPSLTDSERQLFSFAVSGIYWRLRGGGILIAPEETQKKRILYTRRPMGFLGKLNGGDFGKSVGESLHLPLMMKGWSQFMDMGHKTDDKFFDLVFMTDRGAYQVEGGVSLLRNRNYDPTEFAAAGLQMGPCYYFAWEKLYDHFIGADVKAPYKWFLHGATSWGEVCIGSALGLGLSRSLLAGYVR